LFGRCEIFGKKNEISDKIRKRKIFIFCISLFKENEATHMRFLMKKASFQKKEKKLKQKKNFLKKKRNF